ncbi:hypothetical protein PMAYCL1PPCAC_11587, partial [Pristionchus mayeri]
CLRQFLQIVATAEVRSLSVEHGNLRIFISLESLECLDESLGSLVTDAVVSLRIVDRDDEDAVFESRFHCNPT